MPWGTLFASRCCAAQASFFRVNAFPPYFRTSVVVVVICLGTQPLNYSDHALEHPICSKEDVLGVRSPNGLSIRRIISRPSPTFFIFGGLRGRTYTPRRIFYGYDPPREQTGTTSAEFSTIYNGAKVSHTRAATPSSSSRTKTSRGDAQPPHDAIVMFRVSRVFLTLLFSSVGLLVMHCEPRL